MKKFIFSAVILICACCVSAQSSWEKIKTPYWGGVSSVIKSNNKLFACSGSLYSSVDEGRTWDKHPFTAHKLALTPNGDIYAASGTNTVYKSTDKGVTWSFTALPSGEAYDITVSQDGNIYAAGSERIYRSTDGGKSWAVQLLPAYINRIYAARDGRVYAATYGGLYISQDEGVTWVRDTFITGKVTAVSEDNSGAPVIGTVVSWNLRINILKAQGAGWDTLYSGQQGGEIGVVKFNSRGEMFFSGIGVELMKSTDSGASWSAINTGDKDQWGIRDILFENDNIYIGAQGRGLLFSGDNGLNWSSIGAASVQTKEIAALNSGIMLAGLGSGRGVISSADAGNNWLFKNDVFYNNVSCITGDINRDIYIGTADDSKGHVEGGMYKSTDYGETFFAIDAALPIAGIYDIEFYSKGKMLAATSGLGFYYTEDDGGKWAERNNGINSFTVINTIFRNSTSDYIVAGASDAEGTSFSILRSTDNGGSWAVIPIGTDILDIKSVNNLLVAAGNGETGSPAVYTSGDGGITWIASASSGLPACKVKQVEADRFGYIWIATSMGVFRSVDNGASWQDMGTQGLQNTPVEGMAFDVNGYAWITTRDGIFKTETTVSAGGTSEIFPRDFILHQNYPNPFNPSTSISFRVKSKGFVNVAIFDMTGRLIATLVNEVKEAGKYDIIYDARRLPSGVYYYRLSAGSFSESRRMVLIK